MWNIEYISDLHVINENSCVIQQQYTIAVLSIYMAILITENINLIPEIYSIVLHALPKTSCIHFIGDDHLITSTLWMLGISLIINPSEDIQVCEATGYVISYENPNNLQTLFSNIFLIQPHTRVLIFCITYSCEGIDFRNAKYHALDIITIETQTFNIKILNSNKTISSFKHINQSNFQLIQWRPVFANKIRILVVPYSPYTSFNELDGFGGFETRVVEYLTKDFRVEYILYNKFDWMVVYDHLKQRLGNIGVGGFWQWQSDDSHLDNTVSYVDMHTVLLVPKPQTLPYATFPFQPMSVSVWVLIILTSVLIALLVRIFLKISVEFTLIAILLQNSPQNDATRVKYLLPIWPLLVLLIYTAYCAGLSSALTKPHLGKMLKSLEDLAKQETVCHIDIITKSDMESSGIKYLEAIAKLAITAQSTRNGDRIFCTESDLLYDRYISPIFNPVLPAMILKEAVETNMGTLMLNRNSPLTKIFNKRIRRLREGGIMEAWFQMEKYKQYPNLKNMSDYFSPYEHLNEWLPIELRKLQGMFFLWIAGCLLATGRFCWEIFSCRH